MAAPHFIEIDGRRWRATDPAIPEPFRKELVDELMRARRAVGIVGKAGDDELLAPWAAPGGEMPCRSCERWRAS